MNRFHNKTKSEEGLTMIEPLLSDSMSPYYEICAGVPLTGKRPMASTSLATTEKTPKSFWRGFFALLLGVVLSVFAWVSNQGWTILSLLLFGPFQWTFHTAWKHLIFCTIGSLCTSIAWCRTFALFFPEDSYGNDDDDEDDDEDKTKQKRKDVSDALQELGELGFVVGYLGSQYLGTMLFNKANMIITYERSGSFDGTVMILLILWVLCAKVKDYKKAVKRAVEVESKGLFSGTAYVQVV